MKENIFTTMLAIPPSIHTSVSKVDLYLEESLLFFRIRVVINRQYLSYIVYSPSHFLFLIY